MTVVRLYPKIPHIDNVPLSMFTGNVYIQEKIDGANGSFTLRDDGTIQFTSHYRIIPDDEMKMFAAGMQYVRRTVDVSKMKHGYIYYGEYGIKHTLSYDNLPLFIGFDVYDTNNGRYLDAESAKLEFERIGLTFVPMLRIVKYDELSDVDSDIPSAYGPQQAEGLVIKSYDDNQQFAKIVNAQFKELNRAIFGSSNRRLGSDAEKIVHRYVTDARIMKVIYRHTDDGEELHMRLMMILPQEVWDDVIDEHAKELLTSSFIINMREIKKLINRKCVEVLKAAVSRDEHNNYQTANE